MSLFKRRYLKSQTLKSQALKSQAQGKRTILIYCLLTYGILFFFMEKKIYSTVTLSCQCSYAELTH